MPKDALGPVPRLPKVARGCPRASPEEARGGPRVPKEAQGGPRMPVDALGPFPRRPEGARGGPRVPKEALGPVIWPNRDCFNVKLLTS